MGRKRVSSPSFAVSHKFSRTTKRTIHFSVRTSLTLRFKKAHSWFGARQSFLMDRSYSLSIFQQRLEYRGYE